jgi:hypothetical protein
LPQSSAATPFAAPLTRAQEANRLPVIRAIHTGIDAAWAEFSRMCKKKFWRRFRVHAALDNAVSALKNACV